jgi:hypothetical protein
MAETADELDTIEALLLERLKEGLEVPNQKASFLAVAERFLAAKRAKAPPPPPPTPVAKAPPPFPVEVPPESSRVRPPPFPVGGQREAPRRYQSPPYRLEQPLLRPATRVNFGRSLVRLR